MKMIPKSRFTRRDFLKLALTSTTAAVLLPALESCRRIQSALPGASTATPANSASLPPPALPVEMADPLTAGLAAIGALLTLGLREVA